jgi:hypothetical protein
VSHRGSRGPNCCFDRRYVGAVFFDILEQMAIGIEGHPDGRVPHNGLDALGRPLQVLDKYAGCGVAQGVETVAVGHDRITIGVLLAPTEAEL